MKIIRRILIVFLSLFALLAIVILIAFGIQGLKTKRINNDYDDIYTNDKYKTAYYIDDIDVINQKISCGYAVIEMFAKWIKSDITEQSLYDEYGKVVTQTGKSFANEMNKRFSGYETTMYKYLNNTELIDKVYESLSNGIPVPFEWAAKYKEEWTLHYSLVVGIDIPNDKIKIANPYGYNEEISIKEFTDRTTFKAYQNMPLFLRFGFAFGIFEKNTIFIVRKK